MSGNMTGKTIRRLTMAEGYLELDMPSQALEELDAINDAGPYAAVMHYLKGVALKGQCRWDDAIVQLKQAAQLIPAPHNKAAWVTLSECFRAGGRPEMAEMAEMFANAEHVTETLVVPVIQVNIMPAVMFNRPSRNGSPNGDVPSNGDQET